MYDEIDANILYMLMYVDWLAAIIYMKVLNIQNVVGCQIVLLDWMISL